jgi:hypothetical protein
MTFIALIDVQRVSDLYLDTRIDRCVRRVRVANDYCGGYGKRVDIIITLSETFNGSRLNTAQHNVTHLQNFCMTDTRLNLVTRQILIKMHVTHERVPMLRSCYNLVRA